MDLCDKLITQFNSVQNLELWEKQSNKFCTNTASFLAQKSLDAFHLKQEKEKGDSIFSFQCIIIQYRKIQDTASLWNPILQYL